MKDNLLIHGDNLQAMKYLLEHGYKDKIDLIYIDPPYFTQKDFYYIDKQKNQEVIAYSDKWDDLQTYLTFLKERIILMKELLSEKGSIYVQLDWHASHYVKVMMDEIFGYENFRNEIVWSYPAASFQTRRFFMRSFDIALFYSKSDNYIFNDIPQIYMEYSERVKKALKKDEKGYYYLRGGSFDGKKLAEKVYVEKEGIFPRDVWNDIPYVRANTSEYQAFDTQKPEALLKRVILASSNEGNLIADFFCGSGTTLAVAEKLNRRWIGVDSSDVSIEVTKKRLNDSDYVFLSMNDLIVNKWSEFFIFEQ